METLGPLKRGYLGILAPIMENQMERKWKMKWKLREYRDSRNLLGYYPVIAYLPKTGTAITGLLLRNLT